MKPKALIIGLMLIAGLGSSAVNTAAAPVNGSKQVPAQLEGKKKALKMVKELKLSQNQFNILTDLCTQEVKARRSMEEKIAKIKQSPVKRTAVREKEEPARTENTSRVEKPTRVEKPARQTKAQKQTNIPINQEYLRPGTVVAPSSAESSRVAATIRPGSPALIMPSNAAPVNQVAIASTLNPYNSVESGRQDRKAVKEKPAKASKERSTVREDKPEDNSETVVSEEDPRIEKIKASYQKGHDKRVARLEFILTEAQYNKWMAAHPEGL